MLFLQFLSSGSETVLTSHHHCSGDLIHRAVFFWPLVVERAQETVVFLESCIRRNTQHTALE